MAVLGRRLPGPQLALVRLTARLLVTDRLAAKPFTPAPDVPDGWRGEVHRAAQCAGIAVALEKGAASGRCLFLVVVDPHHKIRIARLDRRVDQIAGELRLVTAAPGADGKVIGCVTRCRGQPDVVVDCIVAGDEFGLFGVDDRQNAVPHRVERGLTMDAVPIFIFFFGEEIFGIGKGRDPTAVSSRVFQPTWSPCRCVHMTMSMSSMVTPAALSACIQLLSLLRCQVGRCGNDLSLPMQASTRIVWCGVLTT